jgi:Plasmid encoded RepA protein
VKSRPPMDHSDTGGRIITPAQNRILNAAEAILQDPQVSDQDRAFIARQVVQVTLPHADPGDVPVWKRSNGFLTLSIRPGWDHADNCQLGYPYGTLPRLLLFWLTTEAVRTTSRRLELGATLASFMRELGLDPGRGGKRSDAYRLREQMQRLFRATISFETSQQDGQKFGKKWLDMQVAPQGELWWDLVSPEQPALWGSWVELGEAFHDAIIASPVPVDLRALRALKKSPLALDLYAWATYKTYAVNRSGKEGQPVPWRSLQKQLGCDYSNPRHFKAAAKIAVRKVQLVFPGFHVDEYLDEHGGGLIVKRGTTSVSRRKTTVALQLDQ